MVKIKSLNHKKYKRFDIKCYKDPVRNILVQATPEEAVRQDVIQRLQQATRVVQFGIVMLLHESKLKNWFCLD